MTKMKQNYIYFNTTLCWGFSSFLQGFSKNIPWPRSKLQVQSLVLCSKLWLQVPGPSCMPQAQAKCPGSMPKLHTPDPGSGPQAKLQAQTPCPRLQSTNLSFRPRLEFLAQAPVPSPNSRPQVQVIGFRPRFQFTCIYRISPSKGPLLWKGPPPLFEKIWI